MTQVAILTTHIFEKYSYICANGQYKYTYLQSDNIKYKMYFRLRLFFSRRYSNITRIITKG